MAIISTHPVQYFVPVYAAVEQKCGVPVHAIYGSDFSISGGFDHLFQKSIRWDNFTLSRENTTFLATVKDHGPKSAAEASAAGLRQALQRVSPAAVLLTGYHPKFHLFAFFTAKRLGVPILFRADTTDYAWQGTATQGWMRDQLLRFLYRGCDRLLPVGTHSYEHYRRLGCPDTKLTFAPFCVDASVFAADEESREPIRSAKRRELGVDEQQIVLLFSGKLAPHKAPHLVIEAVRQMPPANRARMFIVFLGSGPEQPRLEALASGTNAGDVPVRVHFAGFQNQSHLSPYYHCADLLVMPSAPYRPYRETWGLVVNEALHHGLPCVVSDSVGCAIDLIAPGITGEITATGNCESLAAGIGRALRLVRDPEIRRKCRDQVSRFTVERAAEGIAKAFRSVTGG